MKQFPESLENKLLDRAGKNALRHLPGPSTLIDFSSNDYLGFARSSTIFEQSHQLLLDRGIKCNGATGSRLISGNHVLLDEAETRIAGFHQSQSALLYNSGYDANVGFFSSVPQRGDIILFDELCHASIRDGIRLSSAKAYKYGHNDFDSLEHLIERYKQTGASIYVATESVFSMDGDSPDLAKLAALCNSNGCYLVVDEAHGLGVFGESGSGLVQELQVQNEVFARIMTFGKGLGGHGAAILGSTRLREYLINFSRSLIYTTALPPHSAATIIIAYQHLVTGEDQTLSLQENILHFNRELARTGISHIFVKGKSAIKSAIIPGNQNAKDVASALRQKGFDVKAILSPTVPEGQERIRICLHSFNSAESITELLEVLAATVFAK